ncbi:MAG: S-layer homology domain-containing protein [Lachnospiraceae bacterium]|nr:S-layer homology domain-containing protein [Lachnospiraceae bacterium]
MKKKIIAFMLALVLVGGVINIFPAQAAQYTEEEMSEKILKVKKLFDVPEEFSRFYQDVWENGNNTEWSFSWNSANYDRGMRVSLDDNDHVKSYEFNDYTGEEYLNLPKKDAEYYEGKAMEFVKNKTPEIDGHLSLYNTSISYYSDTYNFVYQRMENGYPMPDNTVRIDVNYDTGKVVQFSSSWDYDVEVKKPGTVLTKKEAAAKLAGKLDLELRYFTSYGSTKKEAFLAYVPSDRYFSVDANTGKIYTEKNYYGSGLYGVDEESETKDVAGNGSSEGGRGEVVLSEAEIAKVKEMATLISKEEAIAVITSNKKLLVDPTLKYTNAYLSSGENAYYWNITMSDPRPIDYDKGDYYRASLYATVDAKTGKLLNFNSSVPSYWDYADASKIELKYSKASVVKKFEEFVKEIEPEKFALTKKVAEEGGYTIYWDDTKNVPVYGGQTLTYARYVNDIPYYDNMISGAVDRVTGKVYNYYCEWSDDMEFPSAQGAITKEEAFDKYLESNEFELIYEVTSNTVMDEETYISSTKNKARLCYVTNIKAAYVDALTGKFLNYSGEEYKPVDRNRKFSDIAGHKYEKEIRFITQLMNNFEGDKFEPDKKATNKFMSEILSNLWYFYQTPTVEANDKTVTRQKLAMIIVEALGYKRISEYDIYSLNFKDADKVSKKYRGAVAICNALGIFDVKAGEKFGPKSKVTRGEVAAVIAKALVTNKMR